eukprot:CAMPEP_0170536970 /NCGR_PEP_ID=MMETSP0209-20121228/102448_1 /TAXON_ID=665100 ORGANISM="Litonotus pictus, Strain P1" /NCGR_SAMPLE_ID=MMETSP0209 /ASSEMBLY_ACC=CAM_ASM_000301 /LENGTH=304 /DNA_ID=CAMNT_0010838399 /DNA_START=1243 /DNA_END=2157 /DNA_ORIENTATION=-
MTLKTANWAESENIDKENMKDLHVSFLTYDNTDNNMNSNVSSYINSAVKGNKRSINEKQAEKKGVEETEEADQEKKEDNSLIASYVSLLQSQYRLLILILPMIWLLDAFAFYAINFMIKYIKVNLYFLSVIVFCSEAWSFYYSNSLSSMYGKRNTMIISFCISGVSFLLFYFLEDAQSIILFVVLTFLCKFGASVVLNISSLYTNESFPTYIRGRAMACCSSLGKFGGIIAPYLVELSPLTGLISGFVCFCAVLLLLPLKNTQENTQFNDEKNYGFKGTRQNQEEVEMKEKKMRNSGSELSIGS